MRLIDRDALIKRLSMLKKRIALPAAGFVDEDSYECGAVDALCDAIRYAEEAPAVVMDINDPDNWISVKDRMPDAAGYNCLVVGKNCFGQKFVFTAFTGYGEPGWWTYDKTRMRRETSEADNRLSPVWEITHWMPLPEPPKAGESDA